MAALLPQRATGSPRHQPVAGSLRRGAGVAARRRTSLTVWGAAVALTVAAATAAAQETPTEPAPVAATTTALAGSVPDPAPTWCRPVVNAAVDPGPLSCWMTLSSLGGPDGMAELFARGDLAGVELGDLPAHVGTGEEIVASIEAAYLRWEQEEQERLRAEAAAAAEERARQQRQQPRRQSTTPRGSSGTIMLTSDMLAACGVPPVAGTVTPEQYDCLVAVSQGGSAPAPQSGGEASGGGEIEDGRVPDGVWEDGSDQPPVGSAWDGPVPDDLDFPPVPDHCTGGYMYDSERGYICF